MGPWIAGKSESHGQCRVFGLFPVLDFTISDFQLQGGDLALFHSTRFKKGCLRTLHRNGASHSRYRANHVWLNVLAHALRRRERHFVFIDKCRATSYSMIRAPAPGNWRDRLQPGLLKKSHTLVATGRRVPNPRARQYRT